MRTVLRGFMLRVSKTQAEDTPSRAYGPDARENARTTYPGDGPLDQPLGEVIPAKRFGTRCPGSFFARSRSNRERLAPFGRVFEERTTTMANPFQPTDDQMYLAERLSERYETDLTVPMVVKLNRTYGTQAALDAMRQLHGFPPEEPVENLYGWLQTVAAFKAAG